MKLLPSNIRELLEKSNFDTRLSKQFLYDPREEFDELNGSDDVADDVGIMRMEGLYHRYPTKVLIFPTESCFGECRFCFRKHIRQNKVLSNDDFDRVLNYISTNKQINEVIFSGGDPLTLDNVKLFDMISKIRKIETVKIVRIHTRVLTYAPERLDKEFIDFISTMQPLFMAFHINSALEISDIAREKVAELVNSGVLCFSQTALLHEVNDSSDDLKELFIQLLLLRIKPYYLFHPDRVLGNDHFYVSIDKGIELYKSLFNSISGLAMPLYLLNIPNGGGHCIVDLNNIEKINEYTYRIYDWQGNTHNYIEESCNND